MSLDRDSCPTPTANNVEPPQESEPSREAVPIGSIARDTGVTVVTLRHYDQVGLIAPIMRVGGKRRFSPDTVGRVNFIRRAQRAGFQLDEIKQLLDDRDRRWPDVVEEKLKELRERRRELDAVIDMLEQISECGCTVVADCPRLDQC